MSRVFPDAAKRRAARYSALLMLVWATGAVAASISVRDDLDERVVLPQPAQRIVSLAPHATEMLFAAGAGARVVGAVRYSDHPAPARRIARVGDASQLDIERIVALRPDLLVAWASGNSTRQLEQLHRIGIPIFYSEPRKLEDIPQTVLRFGQLAGSEQQAARVAQGQKRRLAELDLRYRRRPVVPVFYQIWDRPLYTLNGQHIISEVLRLCGGENVFASLGTLASTVSLESVLQRNPEVIISGEERPELAASEQGMESDPRESAQAAGRLATWARYPALLASQRGNLFTLDGDWLHRPGPRLIDGAAMVCTKLEVARSRRPPN
jgi:iron complex transport system substrate-binding protein